MECQCQMFHHVGAGGEVGSRPAGPAGPGTAPQPCWPWASVFEHQVVPAVLGGAGHVAAEGDLLAGQVVLGGVVDVHARRLPSTAVEAVEVVDGRLHAVGVSAPFEIEVVGHELVVMRVFAHDVGLPLQEGAHLVAAEILSNSPPRDSSMVAVTVRGVLPGSRWRSDQQSRPNWWPSSSRSPWNFSPQVLDEQALHVIGDGIGAFSTRCPPDSR